MKQEEFGKRYMFGEKEPVFVRTVKTEKEERAQLYDDHDWTPDEDDRLPRIELAHSCGEWEVGTPEDARLLANNLLAAARFLEDNPDA